MVHNVRTTEEFKGALKEYDIVAVDFFATWCEPCKAIAPFFAHCYELDKFKNFRFVKVNVDELTELCEELQVRSMPTFQLYRRGEKVGEVQGTDRAELTELLEEGL
ncbi:thioredoxin domain-containing [Fusarium albosuccineum]|uniref:Thioredoxin n=1 Tax=Fusarium albosuccineum TaxID=1237068 RepID=A0A8H4L3C8_9HYPO|nr:thioredoxin domain-containing [Fusarium albosuccineum]